MSSQYVHFSTQKTNGDFPTVLDIAPQELLLKKSEVLLIDVRRPDEFTGELGHIPDAQLIVLDTLPQHLGDLPKEKTVVFVCRSGARSARAVAFAKDAGFTSVYNLDGGMILWNQLQLAVEGKSAP